VINQIRGFLLERGIIVRQGQRFLRRSLPDILVKRTDVLSPRMVRIVSDLAGDCRQLDERIETVTDEIETLAKSDDSYRRVMTVPGIVPLISSAMVAAIGNGTAFAKGRNYSAWLGLVPRQMSTGDRLTFWLWPSSTSWHGSPGPCWRKSVAMRRASQRQQPEMNTLRFTKGMVAAPLSPPSLARSGE
jgi:hypothetical protein